MTKSKVKGIDSNVYVKFGKFLLYYLNLVKNVDELDWFSIIRQYDRLTTSKQPGLMHINWVVCAEFDLDPVKVRYNKNRKPEFTLPKHVAMYLANTLFEYTQDHIYEFYEYEDRSIVSHVVERIERKLAKDKHFKTKVENIISILLG